jgi:hypothetical protein
MKFKLAQSIVLILISISIFQECDAQIFKRAFNWKYRGKSFNMELILNDRTYNYYKKSDKRLLFTKEIALAKFLNIKENDNLIAMITNKLSSLARINKIATEEMPEFAAAFVQYIPYDSIKAQKILAEKWSADTDIYFHYETVYLNRGVCTDKSILLVSILRKLGYGAALLLMEKHMHAAAAIECPRSKSINNSGYCYIETTAPAPIGYIPKNILEKNIEILQKTSGAVYTPKF